MKELIKGKLKKYEYKYSENNNNLSINMGLSLFVIIEFNENGSINMTDKLKGWNLLTGLLSMSVKASMIYQSIGIFIATFLLILMGNASDDLLIPFLFILVGSSVWALLWSFFYLTKSENMKKQLVLWIEQNEKD